MRRNVLLTLCLTLLAACGPADAPPQPDPAEPAVTATADQAPAGDRGEGVLTLGDNTYEFNVRACDVSGEADDVYQTISGRGVDEAGETFDIFVSRTAVQDMMSHTVSFQQGDVRTGAGTVFEANRVQSGGNWISVSGGAAEPLVQIDGNRVVASGVFVNDATGESLEGRLEATCNQ